MARPTRTKARDLKKFIRMKGISNSFFKKTNIILEISAGGGASVSSVLSLSRWGLKIDLVFVGDGQQIEAQFSPF